MTMWNDPDVKYRAARGERLPWWQAAAFILLVGMLAGLFLAAMVLA